MCYISIAMCYTSIVMCYLYINCIQGQQHSNICLLRKTTNPISNNIHSVNIFFNFDRTSLFCCFVYSLLSYDSDWHLWGCDVCILFVRMRVYLSTWGTYTVDIYASPTSGEAYRNRRLTTNFELWVEIFCVPTCFHMRIPKPCLSVRKQMGAIALYLFQSNVL